MAFTVFLSSEMSHLADTRRRVKRQLEATLRHIPVEITGIDFQSGADPNSTMMACIHLLQQADMFIALFGARLGTYNQSGFTGTEIEIQTALRLPIPKIVVDLTPGITLSEREPQLSYLFDWLKDASGGYFRYLTADNESALIDRLAKQIARDHELRGAAHRKSYFSSISTSSSREFNRHGLEDIDDASFTYHYQQLLQEHSYYTYHGDMSQLLDSRFYIYAYIRKRLSTDLSCLGNPAKNLFFLGQAARALQLFADAFNFIQYTGNVNKDALWCANTASYIYLITGDLRHYKASLVPHIHTFYTMASRFKQRFDRPDGKMDVKRRILLEKARHYSDYLYYLEERSTQKSGFFPDNGYRMFIHRELGDPEGAVKLFRRFLDKQADSDANPFFHLSELVYTQSYSADQTGFKRNLDRLETYYTQRKQTSFEMLIGRKLMDTYFNIGEPAKALTLFDELIVVADGLHSNGVKEKLLKSRNKFITR